MVAEISKSLGLEPGVVRVLGILLLVLSGGTVLRGVRLLAHPGGKSRERWKSLGTWWILLALLITGLSLGRLAVAGGMLLAALLGLREALFLVSAHNRFRVLAVSTLALFLWAWLDWSSLFTTAIPLLLLVLIPVSVLARALPRRPPCRGRWVLAGFWVAVAGPLFLVGVIRLPIPGGAGVSWEGWAVFLLVLTELNDMAQAWWGRAVGSRGLAPNLSPGKTWEGLVGGVLTTVAAGLLLTPLLSPFGGASPEGIRGAPWMWTGLTAALIGVAGVAGDLSVSLLKRRRGVKDAGDLLPAHGGVLDRFDSLSLTAPVFFLITLLLWIRPW
jgi:phosphatidate cytidylyltransferase